MVHASEHVATLPNDDINLAAALRLCGANHLEVESARVALRTAKAQHTDARRKYFPWMMIGADYSRQAGNMQDIPGNVTEESKNSYHANLAIVSELRIGEVMYQTLAAKQRAQAASHDVDAARNIAVAEVTQAYFRLLRAQASLVVSEQSRKLAGDFASQLTAAVSAGVAPEADQMRAQVQSLRHDLMIRKCQEDIQIASARLCEILRLPNGLNLRGDANEMAPLALVDTNATLGTFVREALSHRPELRSREAMLSAAKTDAEGALKAPWYPTASVRGTFGGFGGGKGSNTGNFDDSNAVMFGLGWRIGPGGLFDKTRHATADSLADQEALLMEHTQQKITREVLESTASVRSLKDRIVIVERLLESAEKAYTLTRERGKQGIGTVMETLRSEEDLSFARLAYFDLVTESNIAQSKLRCAMGTMR
jgi:outer membrane protein TolC